MLIGLGAWGLTGLGGYEVWDFRIRVVWVRVAEGCRVPGIGLNVSCWRTMDLGIRGSLVQV